MVNTVTNIKQKIFSTLIIFFVLGMIFSGLEVSIAANQANINLTQTIAAGTLDITAQNTTMNFNNLTAGQTADSLKNLNNIKVTDYRGNSGGWDATTESIGNFIDVDDANTQITLSNSLLWSPGDITNLNSSVITGVTAGTDDQYLNAQRTLMTASAGNGEGAFQIDNTVMNFEQDPTDAAGNYDSKLTLTVS